MVSVGPSVHIPEQISETHQGIYFINCTHTFMCLFGGYNLCPTFTPTSVDQNSLFFSILLISGELCEITSMDHKYKKCVI